MLNRLDDTTYYLFALLILVMSYLLGWLADSILKSRGFGIISNSVIVVLGMAATIYGLDWAFRTDALSTEYLNRNTLIFGPILGGTLLLVLMALVKRFTLR